MAKLTRDTAWRSVQELFRALPADAVVEVRQSGTPSPGTALGVKIEIAMTPQSAELVTWGAPAPPKKTGGDVAGEKPPTSQGRPASESPAGDKGGKPKGGDQSAAAAAGESTKPKGAAGGASKPSKS